MIQLPEQFVLNVVSTAVAALVIGAGTIVYSEGRSNAKKVGVLSAYAESKFNDNDKKIKRLEHEIHNLEAAVINGDLYDLPER